LQLKILVKNMKERKENFTETALEPSKSQRRRDALELRSLAARLIGLKASALARIPMDESVRAAVQEAQAIRSNVARKRQMQYVAKLLRRNDPAPIIVALEARDNEARELNSRHHRTEAWRDYLLESGDPALGALLAERRDADAQSIRQLTRNALKESSQGRAPASARRLFRLLRELDEERALPPIPENF
jgi:ribosome-associated protein